MKPIFIILIPIQDCTKDTFSRGKEAVAEIANDYHVLIVAAKADNIDFKLLNGTEKNYDELSGFRQSIIHLIYESA